MEPNNNVGGGGNMGQNSMHKNTLMALLAYIGPLIIVSYAMANTDPFVKFHIKQGLVLIIISLALWILGSMISGLSIIFNLMHLAVFVLAIIGIVNAVQEKEKELPFVGSFAGSFTF